MSKYFALIAVMALHLSASAVGQVVPSAMDYAQSVSLRAAEGDSGDTSGWNGCKYQTGSDSRKMVITCEGTRQILVHGGQLFPSRFQCTFEFEPVVGGYTVKSETCD